MFRVNAALVSIAAAACAAGTVQAACEKPVYLTFDTGHMEVAPMIAEVLKRQGVKVTFFLANERTKTDGTSLDDVWAPWWKARAAEGHAFGSHTFDHVYWSGDAPQGFRVKPSAGPKTGVGETWTAAQYCAEIQRSATRFHEMTGATMARIFRAPGGKTSPKLLAAASACGWTHVGWSAAGFLGDELPSEKYPNKLLLERALKSIRPGDILLAHLGIWSRKDAWAPADLEPLIVGLKAKGLCFETLREHPAYRAAFGG
jgi:peptidoglycan-N-acetylmuramic acid deacetylase